MLFFPDRLRLQRSQTAGAAKDLFGISDSEYKKNKEYYDALLNDLGADPGTSEKKTEKQGKNAKAKNSSTPQNMITEDVDYSRFKDFYQSMAFTLDELLAIIEPNRDVPYGKGPLTNILAVKKGDTYYTLDPLYRDTASKTRLEEFSCCDAFLLAGTGIYIFIAEEKPLVYWPELSLSAGDAIVDVHFETGEKEGVKHGAIRRDLYSVKNPTICYPFILGRYNEKEDFLRMGYLVNDEDRYDMQRLGIVRYINGEPAKTSPLLQGRPLDRESDSDYCIIPGEYGQSITLAGDTAGFETPGESSFKCTAVCYDTDTEFCILGSETRFVEDGYSIVMDQNTNALEPGIYLLGEFPIHVVA